MVKMIAWDKIFYGFCIGTIFAGIDILLLWSHTSKLVGLALVFIPSILIYLHYTKQKRDSTYVSKINLYSCCLGFLLIFLDIAYNLYSGDALRSLDYGMLSVGFLIVLLNMNLFQFLKLDEKMTSFVTYFLFVFILLYVSLLMGPNILFGTSTNPVFILMIHASGKVSAFFLNFIEPTTVAEGSKGSNIYFSGFKVGLGTACSGVQSMTVFLSAILAFFIANREFGIIKDMHVYCCWSVYLILHEYLKDNDTCNDRSLYKWRSYAVLSHAPWLDIIRISNDNILVHGNAWGMKYNIICGFSI